jgi:uncharacterized protein DUF3859
MKFFLVLTLASISWVTAMVAQEPAVVRSAEIVDFGIYRIKLTGQHVPQLSTGAGEIHPVSNVVLVTKTNQIPATVGTTFGLMFILNGTPSEAKTDVDIVVEHPAFQKPNGETTGTSDKVPWRYRIGERVGYTYTFDHDWEAVPGKWAIEIWRGGKKLVAKEFIVTK